MSPVLEDLLVAAALLALLLFALEVGFRAATSARAQADADARGSGQVGAIQGAILGLLALLLGFSFAAAASRFLERQDLIVAEANAIGTATLRADLLSEPHRSALRTALKDYTSHRLQVSRRIRDGITAADLGEVDRLQSRIWSAAMAGVNDRPQTMLGVLPPINEVIDLHSTRLAAGKKRLPPLVLGLLVASSALAMAVIGYGSGIGGHRRVPLTLSLTILITASLWITYDLDHPRSGLMQLSDAPLESLKFDSGPATSESAS